MNRTLIAALLLVPALVAANSSAGSSARASEGAAAASVPPASLAAFDARIPDDRVFWDEPGDGRVWARGATYKASFGAEGASYVPFLGPRAPTHTVAFVIEEVRVGGQRLELSCQAQVTRVGDVVSLDRGALVESYALAPRSVEQTFTFADLPARGEVVVRLRIDSDLAHASDDAGGDLVLANDAGGVRYGRAVAVDRAGRELALARDVDGDAIVLRVPAEFVERAELPLVIDPIITTIAIDQGTAITTRPDVAYDASLGRFCVVYQLRVTSTDFDVFSRFFDSTGAAIIGSDTFIDQTTESWTFPSLANNNEADGFLVVASVFASGNSLRARRLTVVGGSAIVSASITLGTSSIAPLRARVGGDPITGAGQRLYCVVWEQRENAGTLDMDLRARCVTAEGALVGTGSLAIDLTAGQNDQHPAISRSNDGVSWTIVWERLSGSDGELYGRRISADGSLAGAAFDVETGISDLRSPAVSSRLDGTDRYMVVAERWFSNDSRDPFGILMSGTTREDGTTLTSLDGGVFGSTGPDSPTPDVETDGRHFVVAYVEEASVGSANTNVWVDDFFQVDGELLLGLSRVSAASSSTAEQRVRIASRHSGGDATSRRSMLVWDDADSDIEGAIFGGLTGGTKERYCFGDGSGTACPCADNPGVPSGCPNSVAPGAILDANGALSTTNDTAHLIGDDMPPGSTALYFQGTAPVLSGGLPGAVFGDGLRCAGGTVIRIGTATNDTGGSSLAPTLGGPSLHSIGAVPASGGDRYYQAWYRNAATFCTSATFNLTNGLLVHWAP